MRRLLALLLSSILLAASAGVAAASPGGQSGDHAMRWYLSLGDSLAAGVQPTGVGTSAPTDEGYAEQLLALARQSGMKLGLIKLGCSGETTLTFIEGGKCAYEQGSQLAQALVFIKAHRDNIAFITIDLGWNDFQGCDRVPIEQLQQCIEDGIVSIGTRLPGILAALRDAAGPDIPIVGATIYDPFLAFWFVSPALADLSVTAVLQVNLAETTIFGFAEMPVADVQGAFHTTDTTLVPSGIPLNVATICALTWKCTPFQDNHANKDGYGVMAQAFWAVIPH